MTTKSAGMIVREHAELTEKIDSVRQSLATLRGERVQDLNKADLMKDERHAVRLLHREYLELSNKLDAMSRQVWVMEERGPVGHEG